MPSVTQTLGPCMVKCLLFKCFDGNWLKSAKLCRICLGGAFKINILIADCLHFCIPLEIVRRILWICARWWRWDNRDSWSAGDAKWPLICHPKSEIKVFIIRNNWITKGCSVWCRLINISVGYAWEVVLCGLVVNHLGWCLHPLYNGLYYILQLLMYLGLGEIYSSGIHEDV